MIGADVTGGIIVGALAGSVVPIVGTITGAILGGAYMYFRGKKREQQLIQQFYSAQVEKVERKSRKTRS